VDILWKLWIVSTNYLLRYDTDFHNIMIADLFKCMCVNGTMHIVYTLMTNEYVNNKAGE
jgi:hypothetical protein